MLACMRHRGFSLAEAIIAISILGLVMMTLGGLLTSGLASSDKGEEGISAVHLAESEMGRLKARPYAEILALLGTTSSKTITATDGREYQCSLTVNPLNDSGSAAPNPAGKVLQLSVTLHWSEQTALGGGGTRSERPASLVLESVVGPGASL